MMVKLIKKVVILVKRGIKLSLITDTRPLKDIITFIKIAIVYL